MYFAKKLFFLKILNIDLGVLGMMVNIHVHVYTCTTVQKA